MQPARLIPTTGIGSEKEAEQRAVSALLAVLTIVRDLSVALLGSLGASRARRATVEAFTEVIFKSAGRTIRPDGLLRVSYGANTWACLVEVKTGDGVLEAEQVNAYWDLARAEGFDHVVTISNEIAPSAQAHPTQGLRVRSNSPVGVSHLSWTAILTTAVRLKQHAGVDDPEQAWILGELIRYLRHPASGALAFVDMGSAWVGVRDAARTATLSRRDDGVADVCSRWDQLLRYAALQLGSEIGEDVTEVLSRAHRDPRARIAHLVQQLCAEGRLDGVLRIPNTVGDVHVEADLHGQQLLAWVDVAAPEDRGAVGRVSWLGGQLADAPAELVVEAYVKNARTPTTAALAAVREDRAVVLDENKREPYRFRLVLRADMGKGRTTGRKTPGFIDSVLALVDRFYGEVVQNLASWTPPAPKLKRPRPLPDTEPPAGVPEARDADGTPQRTAPTGEPPAAFESS